MIVENRNNNRREPFLRIEFKDEDEYQHFIHTLKEAHHISLVNRSACTSQGDPLITTIEKFKRVNQDEKISCVIWQENMLDLFCLFYDMVHLVVELNKAYTLSCDIIELYKEAESKYETIVSLKEETINHLNALLTRHKLIISLICEEGLVLDDDGKKLFCTNTFSPDDNDAE